MSPEEHYAEATRLTALAEEHWLNPEGGGYEPTTDPAELAIRESVRVEARAEALVYLAIGQIPGAVIRLVEQADKSAAERDRLVEALARSVSLPPAEIAKAHSVAYGGSPDAASASVPPHRAQEDELAAEVACLNDALDLIGTIVEASTGDVLEAIRSVLRRVRPEALDIWAPVAARRAQEEPAADLVELVAAATERHHLDLSRTDADGHSPCVCGGGMEAACRSGRVADGISDPLEPARVRGLGNAVVPAVGEYIGRLICRAAVPTDQQPGGRR